MSFIYCSDLVFKKKKKKKPETPKMQEESRGKEIPRQFYHALMTNSHLLEAFLEGKYTDGYMPLLTLLSLICSFYIFYLYYRNFYFTYFFA